MHWSSAVDETIGLVPILRAGLGMAEAILDMVPSAQVWHIGLYRDHETLRPVTYYNKLPPRPNIELAFVVDPMLATGGSAVAAVDILKGLGTQASEARRPDRMPPKAWRPWKAAHPDVPIILWLRIDSHLDQQKYIVPGLGDAGDHVWDRLRRRIMAMIARWLMALCRLALTTVTA